MILLSLLCIIYYSFIVYNYILTVNSGKCNRIINLKRKVLKIAIDTIDKKVQYGRTIIFLIDALMITLLSSVLKYYGFGYYGIMFSIIYVTVFAEYMMNIIIDNKANKLVCDLRDKYKNNTTIDVNNINIEVSLIDIFLSILYGFQFTFISISLVSLVVLTLRAL